MENVINSSNLDQSARKKIPWNLVISIGIHFLFLILIQFKYAGQWNQFASTKPSKEIEIEIVDLSKQKTAPLQSQIVQTQKIEKSEKVAPDSYLGEQTQIVQEQTKTSRVAKYTESRTGGSQKFAKISAPTTNDINAKNLGVKMDYTPMGNLGPHSILPPSVSSNNDYLKDLKNGSETLLNTKEFKYYTFFQRVRSQLEQYWEPGLRERLRKMVDRGREIAAEKEHSTMLLVVLNTEGNITKIQIQGTSGLLDLDQAAIDAFNKAGPFPNPPKGMVERDGTIKVEWEFVLRT